MTEFQRSVTSFRRQGSSGLVWDDKFITGLENQNQTQEEPNKGNDNQPETEVRGQRQTHAVRSSATLDRNRSTGTRPYRTVNVASPSIDPPSPKVATCGFCSAFRKPTSANHKSKKRR